LAFLAIKAFEWHGEIARGLLPSESTFLATYFTLTGVHAAHVIGGLIANLWALAGANSVGDAMTANRLRALTMYWTFIDLVWLVIFVVMYLS
jgi:heme/copper-type cytochrome/quinol oxidase subunit 3